MKSPITTTIAGIPPTSAQSGLVPPIVTDSTVKAPVFPSWTVTNCAPVFIPAGTVYESSPEDRVVWTTLGPPCLGIQAVGKPGS